ncbi:hypothetical protein Q7A53_05090 [Halobacillus rhizosphaerae]|uniref:hypothetical protein n=1 Tax=Halobacillus rhizosphaerae TaxID=3064889 RepID=UPI00398AD44D
MKKYSNKKTQNKFNKNLKRLIIAVLILLLFSYLNGLNGKITAIAKYNQTQSSHIKNIESVNAKLSEIVMKQQDQIQQIKQVQDSVPKFSEVPMTEPKSIEEEKKSFDDVLSPTDFVPTVVAGLLTFGQMVKVLMPTIP